MRLKLFWSGLFSSSYLAYSLQSLESLDGKEWKCSKFFRIIQWYIWQTRTESLKPCIVFHDRMSCVIICKTCFTNWNAKIAILCASMVVTYYAKLFRMGADRHNDILMSLLLLVTETKRFYFESFCLWHHS